MKVESVVDQVAVWLSGQLSGGQRLSAEVKAAGLEAGFSLDAVKRAADKLDVTSRNEGFPRRSWWSLPGGG